MNAQLGQVDWIERRELGIERAKRRAHRENGDDWSDRAAAYLQKYATDTARGEPFLLEDARELCVGTDIEPSNPKAWGHAVRLAKKLGLIKQCGWAPTRCSNGNPRCLWKAA